MILILFFLYVNPPQDASGGFRWLTVAYGGFRWLPVASVGFRWLSSASDGFRWFLYLGLSNFFFRI